MKALNLFTALTLIAGSPMAFGHGDNHKHDTGKADAAKTMTLNSTTTTTATAATTGKGKVIATGQAYEIAVDGMHCSSCVDNLTKQLEAMKDLGVEKGTVQVSLEKNNAHLSIKGGGKDAASVAKLKESLNTALTKAGFTVTDVKVIN